MDVRQIQRPPLSNAQRVVKQGEERDGDFLVLRLLNKHARVRLSPEPLDLDVLPGRGCLFAVANYAGSFAAAVKNVDGTSGLIVSPLFELRDAFSSSSSNDEVVFTPRRTEALPSMPNIITFTSSGLRLIVGLTNGPMLIYDTQPLTGFSDAPRPLHTFPSPTSSAARDILPNPGGHPDLIAVLYDNDGSAGVQSVVVFDKLHLTPFRGLRMGNNSRWVSRVAILFAIILQIHRKRSHSFHGQVLSPLNISYP